MSRVKNNMHVLFNVEAPPLGQSKNYLKPTFIYKYRFLSNTFKQCIQCYFYSYKDIISEDA